MAEASANKPTARRTKQSTGSLLKSSAGRTKVVQRDAKIDQTFVGKTRFEAVMRAATSQVF